MSVKRSEPVGVAIADAQPPPFVTIHVTRKQAQVIEKIVARSAAGKSKRNPEQVALYHIRTALEHLPSRTYW